MAKTILFILLLITASISAQVPEWEWVVQAGGYANEEGKSIAVDNAGNSYVTGNFRGTATFGSFSFTSDEHLDIFIAKTDATGNWLWANQAGGISGDTGYSIKIDNGGNCYLTGYFVDIATFGPFTLETAGIWESDIFVAKIDSEGNWIWVTQASGYSNDIGKSITIDNDGNCLVTGNFSGTATFGSHSLICIGSTNIFVAKIDADGNWLWATQAICHYTNSGNSIIIDNAGNSYVTGYFNETVTFGSYSLISSGDSDIFVAKMDIDGNWLWAIQAGGYSDDYGKSIIIDATGNTYITGNFQETAFFASYSLTSSGYSDIFVAKMDTDGNWLWAIQAGGSSENTSTSITMDNTGNHFITGYFEGTATFGSYSLISIEETDIFVAKIDANGDWLWATKAGGTDKDCGYAITVDNSESVYLTGEFFETATFGSFSFLSESSSDIFVAKLNSFILADDEITPMEMGLSNYPNPFNPATTIKFSLPNDSKIELIIYNIKGQTIKTLTHNVFNKGNHSIIWNGSDDSGKSVSSGIYFYKLKTGDFQKVRRMILLR
jgi:hypothetical protein